MGSGVRPLKAGDGSLEANDQNAAVTGPLMIVGGGELKVLAGLQEWEKQQRVIGYFERMGGDAGRFLNQLGGGIEYQPDQSQGTSSPGFPVAGQTMVKKRPA